MTGRFFDVSLDQMTAMCRRLRKAMKMKEKSAGISPAQIDSQTDEQPLLRLLVDEARRRGDTLAALARHLGVTYTRLTQWRRGEASISRASPPVTSAAAKYLGVPKVAVLAMLGVISAADFVWPGRESLGETVRRELEELRHDPMLAGFVPPSLIRAAPDVQLFVAMLCREIRGAALSHHHVYEWARALQLVAAGHAQAVDELARLREARSQSVKS